MPAVGGLHHIGFSVTDLDASTTWYSEILGLNKVMEGEQDGSRSAVMVHPDSGLTIGLRQDGTNSGARFSESVSGLDHVSIAVGTRAELDDWASFLSEKGVSFSPVKDLEWAGLLVVRDPDDIPIELASPPAGS